MAETPIAAEKPFFAGHKHPEGIVGWIGAVFHLPGFAHDHGETDSVAVDDAVRDNNMGIVTIWLSLGLLWLTTVLQAVIYTFTNSVALLADAGHNLVDALNSIPLLIAFYLARRAATRRFTYGFGRAEDIAGIFIVISIVVSAWHIIQESFQRFVNPMPLENLGWVILAALIGFVGNEAVAMLQIRMGKRIGSDAMVADGQHARIDGITSLAVLIAVFGAWINIPILDPVIGVLIGVAIIGIAWHAITKVFFRLMDAVDPGIVSRIEHFAEQVEGIDEIVKLRVHWVGHRLYTEITASIDEALTLVEGHAISRRVQETLTEAIPAMAEVVVHLQPSFARTPSDDNCRTATPGSEVGLQNLLPTRYLDQTPSAAPMGAAGLKYDTEGNADWNNIWTDFCDLALAGGPSHRGTLLEPGDPLLIEKDPDAYKYVLGELERGIRMVTGLEVVHSDGVGWIGMRCDSEEMALWLLRAIIVENVSVRREDTVLYFPAGADFRLEKEIKNVITVVAKTNHYWQEHLGEMELAG